MGQLPAAREAPKVSVCWSKLDNEKLTSYKKKVRRKLQLIDVITTNGILTYWEKNKDHGSVLVDLPLNDKLTS
jgi:hypothetical protein